MTTIEWARNSDGSPGQTWNPITGCTRVSAGCDHCYAVQQSHMLATRFKQAKYAGLTTKNGRGHRHFNGVVRCHEDLIDVPRRRRKPTTYFVCSMSDLFHPKVRFEFIDRVFRVMADCPHHTFQVLTKRTKRMARYTGDRWICGHQNPIWHPLPNVWLGTSIENQPADERALHLFRCPAAVRFFSHEPLLGAIDCWWLRPIELQRRLGVGYAAAARLISSLWHIVGGESGPKARPMHPDWAREIRDECAAAGVPFLFKQWGEWALCDPGDPAMDGVPNDPGLEVSDPRLNVAAMKRVGKKAAGRILDGVLHDAMPEVAVRQVD